MNTLVITDNSWDNYGSIYKRFTYIPSDHRVNFCYGPKMQPISNICSQNMLHLCRRSIVKDKLTESMNEIVKFMDYCIIFHNFIEYNTASSYVIKLCIKNDIPFFIFSEHTSEFFANNEKTSLKFKNYLKQIPLPSSPRVLRTVIEIDITFEIYKYDSTPNSIEDVIENIRKGYDKIEACRRECSTINIAKKEKRYTKELSYLEYMTSKQKWMKGIIPRS